MTQEETCMQNGNGSNLAKGLIAGAVGGLVASWVMNVFMENVGANLQDAAQTEEERAEAAWQQAMRNDEPREDATMKTADAVVEVVTGGRHLTWEEKKIGGPIVHYAFGTIMGGLYGAAAESSRIVRSGNGTLFGAALFTGADMIAVPALGLSSSSGEESPSSLATPYAAHLVYGVTTDFVRRLVRAVL
jgi:putative membrane protein